MGFEEGVMEKNSAACAMEWSIELEKALRSKHPGRCVEAILQIGPRLEQWDGEPEATMAIYSMFGLVPGEDRLFANAIFLRLAVAFQLGNKATRIAIVRLFLLVRRHCRDKKRSKRIKGILSKSRIYNHVELLKRVKIVFDTGDTESRALALVMFGCWADFAKDSAQIRYLVLSSLVSSNVLEVRASLFAAGCFSELADDFAYVVLEILVNVVTYSETASAVRPAATRVFAKMGCSYSVAHRAYKTGLKLVVDSSEEDFLSAMLVSLSKLAYKFTLLISEQVEFLLSLLNRETALCIQATALRCLHFIFVKGMCHSLIPESLIKILFSIVDEPEHSSTMQCEALQLLHKIIFCSPTNLACAGMPQFAELLKVVQNASQSPIMSKSVIAIHLLVDIAIKFQRRKETGSDGVCAFPLPSEIASLIMDRITFLVKPLDFSQFNSTKVFEQLQSLLNFLLLLVGEHPDVGVLVLDKVHLFIEHLVDTCSNMCGRETDSAVKDTVEFRVWDKTIGSKLLCIMNRFLVFCLQSLNEADTLTIQVFDKIKLLVQCVHQCSFFDCYTHMIFSLLLDSQTIWICMINRNEESGGVDGNSYISLLTYFHEHERVTIEFVKRMFTQRDTWPAYEAGMHAARQGAWITASFMFGQLTKKVQSDICGCWLKSLSQLAQSERIIQLLLLTKHGSSSLDWLEKKAIPITVSENDLCEIGQVAAGVINEPIHAQALGMAYQNLCSAGSILETTFNSTKTFCFQIWFLALKAKVFGAIVNVLRALTSIPSEQNNISDDAQLKKCIMVESLKFLQQITQISFQLKRLSQEFDLVANSFIGMDSKSSNIIKALALSCSLLAFSAGFAFYIPILTACENLICHFESSQKCSPAMLIQNLVQRLWNLDCETSTNLCMLLEVNGWSKNCCHLLSKNQILDHSYEAKSIVDVCRYAVSGIVCLQNEANKVPGDKILSEVTKNGSQLLLNIISKWMSIPFRIPKFFFKVRPCFGSELFVSNADTRNLDGISVMTGFHFSLNLCLQLKNVPADLPVRLKKFYCILYCSQKPVLDEQNREQTPNGAWESKDMLEMNERLYQYVTEHTEKTNYGKRRRDNNGNNDDDDGAVTAYVHFEELNSRGQGFSNCLLDVSHFPVGSYRIKWHSCCIDSQGSYWNLLPSNAEPTFTITS